MNIVFWALLVLMLLLAIGILILPLLRVHKKESIAYKDSNLGLYEDKLRELDLDLSENRIDQEQYKIARQELDRELLEDIPVESMDTAALHYTTSAIKRPALALVIAIVLPTLAFLMYLQLGMHAAIDSSVVADKPNMSMAAMIEKLENHIKNNEVGEKDWVMLGRAYKHQGRFKDAADAFAKAAAINQNAQLMLEQAEVLALMNNKIFSPEARQLVLKALSQEPDNFNVLWFAGVAEFQAENYWQSIEHLARLSAEAKNDEEINKSVRFYINKSREQLIAKGEQVQSIDEILKIETGTKATAATTTSGTDSSNIARVSLQVDISDDVKQQFAGTDIVFIYAKALQGPKMPLAAQRMTLAELPARVVLDDNMAMVDGMNLSAFGNVIVSARVTKSGSAIAKSGDYIGEITVNDVTSTEVFNLTINKAVQ